MTSRIRDLYIAALCYAKGHKLLSVEREEKLCWFVFENKSLCEQIQQQFFARSIDVNAKEYADAIRTLKDLVFSQ